MPVDIDALLGQLTLDEKAALTSGSDKWHTTPVDRLGVPAVLMSDGPHGLRTLLGAHGAGLGGRSEPATCFPTAVTLGASWDPALAREVGAAIGAEARALGVGVVLGPGINIKRSPLCGRNFEYFSEDPCLAGELGLGLVEGIQSAGVGTSVKHFAANNQESQRGRVSAEVSERALREIYLPAFERVVTAGRPWTVMCAYNRVNGVLASEHRWLLTDVLRDEWGFDGVVVSDWGAVDQRVAALAAGCDLEMPPNLERSPAAVVAAVRAGELDEAVLDTAAARLLGLAERAAQGQSAPLPERAPGDHRALARRAAAESLVLLTNDGTLPLAPDARVAVIGRFAEEPYFQAGGSSHVNAEHTTSLLEALRADGGVGEVAYAPGFGGDDPAGERERAVEAARGADVVVLMLGLTRAEESEGWDRGHLDLPADQLACLTAVAEANPRTVVVLSHGGVVRMPWRDTPRAILDCGLAGQESGGAVADVLTGRVNPSGRLTETVPEALEHSPSFPSFPGAALRSAYAEDVFVGYRGYEATGREVAFRFGHGLSYTTFAYAEPRVDVTGSVAGGDLRVVVEVDVTNTGPVAGKEVVQAYVRPPADSAVARPPRELRGFTKLALEPGETRTARIELGERAFAYWSPAHRRFVVEPGAYAVEVGDRVAVVDVAAPDQPAPLDGESSLEDWVAHPAGLAALRAELGLGEDDPLPDLCGGPTVRVLSPDFPLRRIAALPGTPITPEQVARALERVGD